MQATGIPVYPASSISANTSLKRGALFMEPALQLPGTNSGALGLSINFGLEPPGTNASAFTFSFFAGLTVQSSSGVLASSCSGVSILSVDIPKPR
jgi:hypothetical protein